MWKYVVRRLALGGLTVLAITFIIFGLEKLLPAADNPYELLLNRPNQSEAVKAALRARYGLDAPFIAQYWAFLKAVSQPLWSWWGWPPHAPSGPDLGYSQVLHEPVLQAIGSRVGNTAELMLTSYVVTLLIAVPVGIVSAIRQYSKLDTTVTAAAFVGISIPNYWFGAILIYAFAIFPVIHGYPKIFPAGSQHEPGASGVLDLSWHLVLPVIVLAIQSIAAYARFIRGSMLEVLNQDYIRTARAKGISEREVVLRHAFRNSLLPFITLIGIDIPSLFVGAIITEFVFDWPGMGQLFVISADGNDLAVIMGIALILSVLVVLGNLIADIAYTWADPRISYEVRRA